MRAGGDGSSTFVGDSGHRTSRCRVSLARSLLGAGGMYHYAVRALRGTDLVSDAEEMRALWDFVVERVIGLAAFVVMPDHIHVLISSADPTRLLDACRAFAQWRNHRRGESGPVWDRLVQPPISLGIKVRRDIRYISLNPCRAGLADDPLAWPMSLHRDAVGLAVLPVRPADRDPAGHHAYVSGDPSVRPDGTTLPWPQGRPTLGQIATAVASIERSTVGAIRRKGTARNLFLQAARALTEASLGEIAMMANVHHHTAQRARKRSDRRVEIVARISGDVRFMAIPAGDMWRRPEWRAYAVKHGISLGNVGRWREKKSP